MKIKAFCCLLICLGPLLIHAGPIMPPYVVHDADVIFWKKYMDINDGQMAFGSFNVKMDYYGNFFNIDMFVDANSDYFRKVMRWDERSGSLLSHLSLLIGLQTILYFDPNSNKNADYVLSTSNDQSSFNTSPQSKDNFFAGSIVALGLNYEYVNFRIGGLLQTYSLTDQETHIYEMNGKKYKYTETVDLPYDKNGDTKKLFIDTDLKIAKQLLFRILNSNLGFDSHDTNIMVFAPKYSFGKPLTMSTHYEYFINPYVIITDDSKSRRDFGMMQVGAKYKHHINYTASIVENFFIFEINNTRQYKGQDAETFGHSMSRIDNTFFKSTLYFFPFVAGVWHGDFGWGGAAGLALGEYMKIIAKYNEYSALPLSLRGTKEQWFGFEASVPSF